jgi:hypothetical protein
MSLNKYVLVCNDGTSHDLSRRTLYSESTFDLPDLLDQGWRPVHETPMGCVPWFTGTEYSFAVVLILLVKD